MQQNHFLQPLPTPFLNQTLSLLPRFLLLHPVLVLLTAALTFLPLFLTFYSATFKLLWNATPTFFTQVLLLLLLSPFTLKFFKTKTSAESTDTVSASFSATTTFVRTFALPLHSDLKWPLLLCLALLLSGVQSFFGSDLKTGALPPLPPPSLLTHLLLGSTVQAAMLPLTLIMGGFLFCVPVKVITHLINRQLLENHTSPLGAPLIAFFLTPLLLNTTTPANFSMDILKLNTYRHLMTAFYLWITLRLLFAPLGLASLIDAYAFSALLHASLGGSLQLAAKKTSPLSNLAPTPAQ